MDKAIQVSKSEYIAGLKVSKLKTRAIVALAKVDKVDHDHKTVEEWDTLVSDFLNQKVRG